MQADYIIVGQGISGSLLSRELIKAGQRVIVIDDNKPDAASRVASGIINPVTGRRIVRTWMIERLLPFAQQVYEDVAAELHTIVAHEKDLLTFHTSEQMVSAWQDRIEAGEDFIQRVYDVQQYAGSFHITYGIGVTSPCLLVDVHALLTALRAELARNEAIITTTFDINECIINDEGIIYNGIHAGKLILCNGVQGFANPFFNRLPYAMNKGEAIIVRIPGLPAEYIYKQAMSIVPLGDEHFWVGSSFEWDFKDALPTTSFRQKAEAVLKGWMKLPFTVEAHKAAIRPASIERRPFAGMHPIYKNVGILNGMGTKGCSLAPYFAAQLAGHLLNGGTIDTEADIARFRKLLAG